MMFNDIEKKYDLSVQAEVSRLLISAGTKKALVLSVISAGVLLFAGTIYCVAVGVIHPFMMVVAGIALSIAAAVLIEKIYRSYAEVYRNTVIPAVFRLYLSECDFKPHSVIGKPDFKASRLFLSDGNNFFCEDLASGRLGESSAFVSELSVTQVRATGTQKEHIEVFKGLFIMCSGVSGTGHDLVVQKNIAGQFLGTDIGRIFTTAARPDIKAVQFENAEFMKHFTVLCDDETTARSVIDSRLQGHLLEMAAVFGDAFCFSLIGDRLNIGLHVPRSFASPRLFGADGTRRVAIELGGLLDLTSWFK